MKFTLSWLKDHLQTDASLQEITDALTMIGLEVESVDDRSQYKPFVIAKVISAEQHPDADRLKVLVVDKGDGKPLQVVCGAPNARAGLVGALAEPGTYVPGIDVTLSVGNIRGVESHGMMCSERELDMSDDHDGIIDLPEDAPIGQEFATYAHLDDPVIEIGITPNRPDALGVAGVARDLEAYGIGTVKPVSITPLAAGFECPVDVRLEFDGQSLCPAFGLRYVKGVKNGPSPKWMQQRLKAIGLRPISALVDITNYVTFDLGRPLHVFDADKVAGDLVVRQARKGEKFQALDGNTYELNPDHCVIADNNGVESLAGIMGGEASGCSDDTTNVLVESALWEPLNIARTGRELGIITDARYRFERGVDPAFMINGLDHATNLVMQLCGGEASTSMVAGEVPLKTRTIQFPLSEIERLTGLSIPEHQSISILEKLGFGIEGKPPVISVTVPTNRPDVHGKADLVEEIMRIYGIDKIEPTPLPAMTAVGQKILTISQIRMRNARRALAARGMMEAVTWSFISHSHAKWFGGGDPELVLANPISKEMSDMRPSLLPSLMDASQRNVNRAQSDLALFEVSHVFKGAAPEQQINCAGGIRRGTAKMATIGRSWQGDSAAVDVFDAKEDALSALAACGLDIANLQIVSGGPDYYHPGRSGTIQQGPKNILATFGEIHPFTLDALDVDGPMVGFEVWLDAIPPARRKATKTKSPLNISEFQPLRRDFAFIVEADIQAATIISAAMGADKKLITNVSIFDIYEGQSVGVGKKSVAFEVTIQPTIKTLKEEEIEAVTQKIIANVEKATGGHLRS